MDKDVKKLRIQNAIKHIDLVLNDIKGVSLEEFKKSDLLCRADAFSVAQIGEQLKRLQDFYGDSHPEIPWNKANHMRNIIVHEYQHVDFVDVYMTIKEDLPKLKEQLQSLLD